MSQRVTSVIAQLVLRWPRCLLLLLVAMVTLLGLRLLWMAAQSGGWV